MQQLSQVGSKRTAAFLFPNEEKVICQWVKTSHEVWLFIQQLAVTVDMDGLVTLTAAVLNCALPPQKMQQEKLCYKINEWICILQCGN